jgi:hypothetical protein
MFNFACGPIFCKEVDITRNVTLHKSGNLHAPQGTVNSDAASARLSVWDMQSRR